jgi:hypothetical protein
LMLFLARRERCRRARCRYVTCNNLDQDTNRFLSVSFGLNAVIKQKHSDDHDVRKADAEASSLLIANRVRQWTLPAEVRTCQGVRSIASTTRL